MSDDNVIDMSKRANKRGPQTPGATTAPDPPGDLSSDPHDNTIRINVAPDGWFATVPGVPASGQGKDPDDAIRHLAILLGCFVRGHARTIDELRKKLGEGK